MKTELELKTELEELGKTSAKKATMEPDGHIVIHLGGENRAVRLEGEHCAVAMGSIQGLDVLSENLYIEEDDVMSYCGVYIPEDVYAVLETLFEEIEEL